MLPSTVKCSCELSCWGKLSSDSPSANTNIWIHFNLTKEDLHLNHVICSSKDGTKVWLNNYTALKIKALLRRRLYIYVTSITIKSNSGFSLLFLFFFLFNLRRRLRVFSCPSLFSCHVWSALWIGVDGCGSSCMLHTDCRREKDDSAVIHWDASNSTVLLLIWSEPLVKPILLVI